MIFDLSKMKLPLEMKTDLCIIGSGAGGSMVATVAAEAGIEVLVLEAGEFLTPLDMTQKEEEMFPRLLWDAGSRTNSSKTIKIHQGHGVGGSTLHNLNLCKRISDNILEKWHKDRNLASLSKKDWDALYEEVETMLSVTEIPESMRNKHNTLLVDACNKLGWKGSTLKHNRTGCVGSGFCEIGCAFDAKNNATKILIPKAIKAGAQILTSCQAVNIEHDNSHVKAINAVALNPATKKPIGNITIHAKRICVSASATASAAILIRSNIPDPSSNIGNNLRIHPAVVAAGEFEEPVNAWKGTPQSYECTEFLNLENENGHRTWIVPAFAHPVGTSTIIPGYGKVHRSLMEKYSNLAVFTAMLHDNTRGEIKNKSDLGFSIDYTLDSEDKKELAVGLKACATLLFAAGAKKVYIPFANPIILENEKDLSKIANISVDEGHIDITAVHPMSSIPMSDDPAKSAVSSQGKHHHIKNLWIADGSLFPTSIGGPPQLSIYSLGLHVGRAIVANR